MGLSGGFGVRGLCFGVWFFGGFYFKCCVLGLQFKVDEGSMHPGFASFGLYRN